MDKKSKEELINDLLSHLHNQHAKERGGLPDAGAPQRNLVRYQREKRGFWASLFDPHLRLKEQHEYKRFVTELETHTTLQKLLAEAAIEKAKINKETAIEDHRHKAEEWLKTTALKNSALALHRRYEDFLEALEQSLELNMDEHLQQQFVKNLYELYFGHSPNGSSSTHLDATKKGGSHDKN